MEVFPSTPPLPRPGGSAGPKLQLPGVVRASEKAGPDLESAGSAPGGPGPWTLDPCCYSLDRCRDVSRQSTSVLKRFNPMGGRRKRKLKEARRRSLIVRVVDVTDRPPTQRSGVCFPADVHRHVSSPENNGGRPGGGAASNQSCLFGSRDTGRRSFVQRLMGPKTFTFPHP